MSKLAPDFRILDNVTIGDLNHWSRTLDNIRRHAIMNAPLDDHQRQVLKEVQAFLDRLSEYP